MTRREWFAVVAAGVAGGTAVEATHRLRHHTPVVSPRTNYHAYRIVNCADGRARWVTERLDGPTPMLRGPNEMIVERRLMRCDPCPWKGKVTWTTTEP